MFGFVTVLKFRGEVGRRWGYRVEASLGGGGGGGRAGGSTRPRFPMSSVCMSDSLESDRSVASNSKKQTSKQINKHKNGYLASF